MSPESKQRRLDDRSNFMAEVKPPRLACASRLAEQPGRAHGLTEVFVVQAQVVVQLRADLGHQRQVLQLLQLVRADLRHPPPLCAAAGAALGPDVDLLHCCPLRNKESRYWLSPEEEE